MTQFPIDTGKTKEETWIDPFQKPDIYDGLLRRRVFAYIIDIFFIFWIVIAAKIGVAIFSVLSFFILTPLLVTLLAFIPLAYHTFTISGPRSATAGMRLMGLSAYDYTTGRRPTVLQALITTILFYTTAAGTGGIILFWPLFHAQKRTIHDILANIIVLASRKIRWDAN